MGSIYQSIEILSKEKGIDRQVILDAVKDAMLLAAKKHFKTNEDLEAEFDPRTGAVQIFALKKVVDAVTDPQKELTLNQAAKIDPAASVDAIVRVPKPTEALGRIAAQMAKQVILQKVREAERENVFSEFADRIGEIVNCVVKRVDGQDLVVEMGKSEARISKKEQSRLESFSVGERIRCVIKAVEKAGKNAGVVLSRADASLVQRLFEQEVPEIYDGTVVIKACAREAGERTKIAVFSRDREVDCVGACVGMKGMRVQSIIRELRGEKIDIIEYSEDPVVFATHALSPAKISRVNILSHEERHMEVIVDDSQLSLAIGKKGQNVRLAAKLLGWKIDIKSEEEKRQEAESQFNMALPATPLGALLDHNLPEPVLEALLAGGIATVEKLGSMTPEEIEAIPGIEPGTIDSIGAAVNAFYGNFPAPAEEGESVPMESATEPEATAEPDAATVTEPEPAAEEPVFEPPVAEPAADDSSSATIKDAE
ncbi:MAG: transcription termination factor NusA [Bryobacteraceae bacterium]|nr:transcription termination factor NusA [Bryobacteraceae bacterium]